MENLKYQFSIGNYSNVIKLANKFLEQEDFQFDYNLMMYKAASYSNLLEDQNAISDYNTIIELFPDQVLPKIRIALIQIDIGEFESARIQLASARKIEPDNLEVINNQIFISEQLHEFQNVIDLATEAMEVDENEPSVWLTRASAREKLKEYDLAISDGLKAVSLSGDDDLLLQMVFNDLGHTYSKMGDLINAELYLLKAIEVDDSDPFQFNNLGLVFANKGEIEEGLKYINHSINIDDNNSYAYKNRAKVYLMKGDKKMALKDLNRAKSMDYHLDYDNEVNELLETI